MKAFMYVALAYFQKIIHDRPKLLEKDPYHALYHQ